MINRTITVAVMLLIAVGCSRHSPLESRPQARSDGPAGRYLSDDANPANPYRYLLRLQQQAFADNPRLRINVDLDKWRMPERLSGPATSTTTVGDIETAQANVRRVLEQQLQEPLPTPLENPYTYALLRGRFEHVKRFTTAVDSAEEVELPAIGTLPIPTVNAQAISIPGSDKHLLVVNAHLFIFVHEMTKIALQTIDVRLDGQHIVFDTSPEKFRARIKENPAIRERFVHLLLFFLNAGPGPEPYLLPKEYEPLLIAADDAMESFVVAHELGHVMRKHTSGGLRARHFYGADDQVADYQEMLHSWAQEAEADYIGFGLMTLAMLNDLPTTKPAEPTVDMFMSAYNMNMVKLFFVYAQIVADADHIWRTGNAPATRTDAEMSAAVRVLGAGLGPTTTRASTTTDASTDPQIMPTGHPPAWLRRMLIDTAIKKYLPHNLREEQRAFVQIADAMERNVAILWEEVAPRFVVLTKAVKGSTAR